MKLPEIAQAVVRGVQLRARHGDADIQLELAKFRTPEAGNYILLSDGDGALQVLLPVAKGSTAPASLELCRRRNRTDVLLELERDGFLELPAVGRCAIYSISNVAGLQRFAGSGDAFELTLRGEGFSSRGEDFDFWKAKGLATQRGGGVDLSAPPLDPSDPSWLRLEPEVRELTEWVLGRQVGEVEHISVIQEASHLAEKRLAELAGTAENGAIAAGLDGLRRLGLGMAKACDPEAVAGPPVELLEEAHRAVERVLGEGCFSPDRFPRSLLRLAEDVLRDAGHDVEADRVRDQRKGLAVDRAELASALDAALGPGFTGDRDLGLPLVDAMIDQLEEVLTFEELRVLHELRGALASACRRLFGRESEAEAPLAGKSAAQALDRLHRALLEGTGLDANTVYAVSRVLQSAMNAQHPYTSVVILAGASGTGVDRLHRNILDAVGAERVVQLSGEADLNQDAGGALVGSPGGLRGVARSVLLPKKGRSVAGRQVFDVVGGEAIAGGLVDSASRSSALGRFWGIVKRLAESGQVRGFDPSDPLAKDGVDLDLRGDFILVRTTDDLAALRAQMGPANFAALSPAMVEFGQPTNAEVIDELKEAVRLFLADQYQLDRAKVSLAPGAKVFFEELLDAGMSPALLQRMALDQVVGLVFAADFEDRLVPGIEIDLIGGLTPAKQARVRDDWLEGKRSSVPPFGGKVLEIYDAERSLPEPRAVEKARLQKRTSAEDKIRQLQLDKANLALGLMAKDEAIDQVAAENARLHEVVGAAEVKIDALTSKNSRLVWIKQHLEDLNAEAQQAIVALKGQVAEANARVEAANRAIERQNRTIGELKKTGQDLLNKLETRSNEVKALEQALARVQGEFRTAIERLATGIATGGDPLLVFRMAAQMAREGGGQYLTPLLQHLVSVAAQEAARQVGGYIGRFDKFNDIADLARGYAEAATAVGLPVSPEQLARFEQAAWLSGSGTTQRDPGGDWTRRTGLPSQWVDGSRYYDPYLRSVGRRMRVQVPRRMSEDLLGAVALGEFLSRLSPSGRSR